MNIYELDEQRVWTGNKRAIELYEGRPLNWVRSEESPPVLTGEQVAQWSGAGWVVLDSYPDIPAPATQVPQAVPALEALLALDAAGLSADYEAWANDPARTFAERAFINKAQNWRRDDPTLQNAATALGLSSEQVDQLFIAADLAGD